MAACDTCGKEMRDGDWTCGSRGATRTRSGEAAGAEKTYKTPAHLEVRVEGTPVGGSSPSAASSIALVKGG